MIDRLRRHSPLSRVVVALAIATTLIGCAANKPSPKSPAAEPAATGAYPGQPMEYAQPTQPTTPASQASGGMPGYPPPPPPAQPGQVADSPSRQAANDFDRAERELAVSTSDCGNACRALGSMDRAAGNICKLTEDKPRCDDATTKVRSARTKVKSSCGDCKETSTNPSDPVPSH